jgi:hypothetical protein
VSYVSQQSIPQLTQWPNKALLHSDMARVDHLEIQKSIKLSTHAALFVATPHQGGEGVHLAEIMRRVFSVASYTNPKLLEQVQRHSAWLQDLQARYNAISRDLETVFFYETYEMAVPVFGRILVRRPPALCHHSRLTVDPIAGRPEVLGRHPRGRECRRCANVCRPQLHSKVSWSYGPKLRAGLDTSPSSCQPGRATSAAKLDPLEHY